MEQAPRGGSGVWQAPGLVEALTRNDPERVGPYRLFGRLGEGGMGMGRLQLMYRTVEAEPDLEGVPEALRPLITGCLAHDPDQRTPVAELLAQPAPDSAADTGGPGCPPRS